MEEDGEFHEFCEDVRRSMGMSVDYASVIKNDAATYENFQAACRSTVEPYQAGAYRRYKDAQVQSAQDQQTTGGSSYAGTAK